MSYPTPHDAVRRAVEAFEGGWSDDPVDRGNWVNSPAGRKLIGTMRGVTAATYAKHVGVEAWKLTPERMRREITLDVAADIGVKRFYEGFNIDLLEWGPLAEVVLDFAWGSGTWAIRELQGLVNATVDGAIGPQTAMMHDAFIRRVPWREATDQLTERRRAFYLRISEPPDPDYKYRRGWLRRADWYVSAEFRNTWDGWTPTGGTETPQPIAPPDPIDRARFYLRLASEALGQL